jgi:hypothetical protein
MGRMGVRSLVDQEVSTSIRKKSDQKKPSERSTKGYKKISELHKSLYTADDVVDV